MMKKNKNKIIVGALVCLILFISFFAEKNISKNTEKEFITDASGIQEVLITEDRAEQTPTPPSLNTPSPAPTDNAPDKQKNQDSFIPENTSSDKIPFAEEQPPDAQNTESFTDLPSCTLSVRCDSVLKNLEKLSDAKKEVLPPYGIIFREQSVAFSEGESVFDILQRELKNNKIHLEYVITPMYDSAYTEGIGNLYEFDCGDYSGWLYKVNGIKPTYGCSQYKPKNGDKIEFFYSCNLLDNEE